MPLMMSIFSWLIRRSASLIATSGLLWESAAIETILYLPPTPPFSLTRSIAICAPTEEATEPPAANGPVRSYITPMRTISAAARARVQSRLSTAAAAAGFFSSALREVGIAFLPETYRRFCAFLFLLLAKYLKDASESQHADSSVRIAGGPVARN